MKKIIVGLTGSLGSGKTTVAKIFKSFGAKVIDADKIAHYLLKSGTKSYKKIVSTFGSRILKKNKTINRRRLSQIVFSQRKSLEKLNRIMHPEIMKIIKKEIDAARQGIIVIDAPLLVEAGGTNFIDKLIVVNINRKKQIERIQKRMALSKPEILKRIKCQMPLKDKVRLSDFVIDNSGTIENTKKQVKQIRRALWKN